MSNIKTESDMSILSVKYDLEEQLKSQKVGSLYFVLTNKILPYFRFMFSYIYS